MSVKTLHPFYTQMLDKWLLGLDSYNGEDAIKAGSTKYLPATSGHVEDGQGTSGGTAEGDKAYDAYNIRAVYPDTYAGAVEAAIGIMHKEPPVIELPSVLEPMRENATLLGESLEMLLRRINVQQLITGRLGLLGDLRKDKDSHRPVIAIYNELAVRNWDDTSQEDTDVDLRLVVLDESGYALDADLTWVRKTKYRVLGLIDTTTGELAPSGSYGSIVLDEEDDLAGAILTPPNIMGTTLEEIPFVFINGKDLSPTPDTPPLEGLAKACLVIYRGEADYRQNLFMQGQDTLVRIGAISGDEDDAVRTGAGARIDCNIGGDAKYIGVNSQGLPEQRSALENDYSRALQKSGQLLDATSRAKESGDALRIRVAAQTATLPQMAKTGAAGLQKVLQSLAVWYGANPEEVVVTPNLNFTASEFDGKTLVELLQAKSLGAPLSEESIHGWIQEQGFTELSYEEELDKLANEEPLPGAGLESEVDADEDEDTDADS